MSRRYIDADKLEARINVSPAFQNMGQDGFFLREIVLQILDGQPTADVVEVRHGYWYVPEYEYLGCSECGEWYYTGADSTAEAKERLANGEYYPYCPHCGAKMDGERREQNEG